MGKTQVGQSPGGCGGWRVPEGTPWHQAQLGWSHAHPCMSPVTHPPHTPHPPAVANQGKFLLLFKRPGLPVLLSRRGDLLVRPSTIEHTAHRLAGASITHHYLTGAYLPSLAAVLRAQGRGKPLPGGRRALEQLGQEPAMAALLASLLGMGPACAAARSNSSSDLESGGSSEASQGTDKDMDQPVEDSSTV